MARSGFSRVLAFAVVSMMLVATFAPVAASQRLYPEPAGPQAEEIQDLFNVIMLLAIFVFVFVEAMLLYIIFRFRRNRKVPTGETHRGHTKAEIVWTIIPAAILLFIGIISAQVMEDTDRVPEDVDFTIQATAFQWGWLFTYPDGSESSALAFQAGKKVRLDVTSLDVIHAVWIPSLAIKIDAVPGRVNTVWFEASKAGTYPLVCAEFCYAHDTNSGIGHHSMVADVIVCDPNVPPCPEFGLETGPVATDQVYMISGNRFDPAQIVVAVGTTVTWTNNDTVPHTVTPGLPSGVEGGPRDDDWPGYTQDQAFLAKGQTVSATFNTAGEYPYYCIPHAPGMRGTVIVVDDVAAYLASQNNTAGG